MNASVETPNLLVLRFSHALFVGSLMLGWFCRESSREAFRFVVIRHSSRKRSRASFVVLFSDATLSTKQIEFLERERAGLHCYASFLRDSTKPDFTHQQHHNASSIQQL